MEARQQGPSEPPPSASAPERALSLKGLHLGLGSLRQPVEGIHEADLEVHHDGRVPHEGQNKGGLALIQDGDLAGLGASEGLEGLDFKSDPSEALQFGEVGPDQLDHSLVLDPGAFGDGQGGLARMPTSPPASPVGPAGHPWQNSSRAAFRGSRFRVLKDGSTFPARPASDPGPSR